MTHVIAFATRATADGAATALLPLGSATVVETLIGELRSLQVGAVTVISRPAWADALRTQGFEVIDSADVATDVAIVAKLAQDTVGAVVLTAADVVAHRRALAKIAGVRATRTVAAVTASTGDDTTGQPVLRQREQVISVATGAHDVTGANMYARGFMAVSADDRQHLLDACTALEEFGHETSLDDAAGEFDAIGLVLLALVREGVPVSAYHVRFLQLTRVGTASAASAAHDAVAGVDEAQAALLASRKEDEEFLATYLVQSYSIYLVRFFARYRVTPNAITWASAAVAAGATIAFASGRHGLWVLGAVLLYASFILDCCDGGVARFTGGSTRYGSWFDMISDRIKEYGVYAGLAIGGVRAGETGVWPLALAAITVMTVRHMIDTFYGALQDTATRALPVVPMASRMDRLAICTASSASSVPESGAAVKVGTRLGQLSADAHGRYRSTAYWLKRSVVMPIGDRWIVIAIAAAIWGPKVAFIALLTCMGLAFAYVFTGRTLRTVAMRVPVLPRFDIAQMRDDGPIARAIAGRLPPLQVTLPAIVLALLALIVHTGGDPIWPVPVLGLVALGAALGGDAPHDGPLDWLIPAALRAVEITFYLVAGAYDGVPLPLVYALIAVVVLVHYETASRTEKPATPMGSLHAGLGWDGRVVVISAVTAVNLATLGFAVLTALVATVLVIECLTGLVRPATGPRRSSPAVDV